MGFTRNAPPSAGYTSASVQSAYTSAAQAGAKRGADGAARVLLDADLDRGIWGLWAHPAVRQKNDRRQYLEDGEPETRCHDQQDRLPATIPRTLQRGGHYVLAHPETAGREQRKEAKQVRAGENCDV